MSEIDYFYYNPNLDINQEYQLNQLQDAANDCTYQRQFGLINLDLSEESLVALDAWHLKSSLSSDSLDKDFNLPIGGDFSYHSLLQAEVYPFIQSISAANNPNIKQVADVICRIVDEVANGLDENYEYKLKLTLNAYTREGAYSQGWHIDSSSYDFSRICPLSLKLYEMLFTTALKGPRTLYYVPSDEMDAELIKMFPDFKVAESGNANLAREFRNGLPLKESIFSAPFGYGVLHMYSDYMGSIHDFPSTDYDERLFMSIKIITNTDLVTKPIF